MKKPKLRKYIVKACIVAFILSVLCYGAVIFVADWKHSDEIKIFSEQAKNSAESGVRDLLMGSDPEKVEDDGLKSVEYGQGLADVDFRVKIYSNNGAFSVLYDCNGNVVSDPAKAVFFKVYKRGENGEEEHVRLETEYNDDWEEIFDYYGNAAYKEKIGDNNLGLPKDATFDEFMSGGQYTETLDVTMESRIVLDEIYVKSGYFVPGKVHVRVTLRMENREAGAKDTWTFFSKDVFDKDMTPENTQDYTKITMKPEKYQETENTGRMEERIYDTTNDAGEIQWTVEIPANPEIEGQKTRGNEAEYYYDDSSSPAAWGISEDDPAWNDYEYFISNSEHNGFSVEKFVEEGALGSVYEFDKEFLHHYYGIVTSINVNKDIEGPEYVLVTMTDYSILYDSVYEPEGIGDKEDINILRKVWIPVGVVTLAVFLAIASIIAGFRYMKAKSVYDMKCYRIETTNAMAHDLKTPLTAISGYAENLLEQVQVDKREYYAKAILSNIEYMDRMIHDILELSKSEDIRQDIEYEDIALHEFIDEELSGFEHLIKERGLTISIAGDVRVKTDRSLMKSMLDNLLSNAVKYSAPDSKIEILLGEDAVQAKGNKFPGGIGGKKMMISNKLEKPLDKPAEELVKPYVKGDNSRGSRQGSGVGLAIVSNVAGKLKYKVDYDITEDEFKVSVMM